MITFQSCKKDPLAIPKDGTDKISQVLNSEIVFRSARTGNSTVLNTILGAQRINPFEISKINAAHDTLYGTSAGLLNHTDLYIKFLPTTQDHIAFLDEWQIDNSIPIVDYPLDYEIVTMGEQYIDPNVNDSLYTYRYAAIPDDGRGMPNVPYIVIDSLYLDFSDPILIAQSFYLTGHKDEITDYVFKGGLEEKDLAYYEENGDDIPSIIDPPPTDCDEGCYPILIQDPNSTSPWKLIWICYCPPPPVVTLNACNCPVPSNPRIPAGCVQVDDDDTIPTGVEIATVRVLDSWFKGEVVLTNANGCWETDRRYGNKIRVSLFFANENVKVRNMAYWSAVNIMYDFVGKLRTPPFNNIHTTYGRDAANNDSKGRQYWASAHSLNTVNQYRAMASNDLIQLPRTSLNWTNLAGDGDGAGPMLQGNYFNSWLGLLVIVGFPPAVLTNSVQPDIVNGYDTGETAAIFNGTGFHELGHASHHELVGETYWYQYRNHIINNNGYGSFGNFHPTGSNKGHVALGEAVGNFTGAIYGGTVDGSENGNWDGGNSPDNFIPQGLMIDLIDDTPNELVTDPNDVLINGLDNINGFTREMIFNSLTPSNINNIRKYRDRLRTLHLNDTQNSSANFDAFLDIYDVFN